MNLETLLPPSVALAFSGGKDSTAAALILKEAGCRVETLTMRLGLPGEEERLQAAARLASELDLPWQALDCRQVFQQKVVDYVIKTYSLGLTPNPCALCNRNLKFSFFLEKALSATGCGYFASGHYAASRKSSAGILLCEPQEQSKSQVYFLAMINPQILNRIVFPLAEVSLAKVREMVSALPLVNVKESQDACFLAGRSMSEFLREKLPHVFSPGPFRNSAGEVIGRHDGALRFTIGQRRGTNFACGRRFYVTAIDAESNSVFLGPASELARAEMTLQEVVHWQNLVHGEKVLVKTRASAQAVPALVSPASTGELLVEFCSPARTVTPGQIGVLYKDGAVAAAGFITK